MSAVDIQTAADTGAETAECDPNGIVVHFQWTDQAGLDKWADVLGPLDTDQAFCGFRFTVNSSVTMYERIAEGEEQCGSCERLFLEIEWLAS